MDMTLRVCIHKLCERESFGFFVKPENIGVFFSAQHFSFSIFTSPQKIIGTFFPGVGGMFEKYVFRCLELVVTI